MRPLSRTELSARRPTPIFRWCRQLRHSDERLVRTAPPNVPVPVIADPDRWLVLHLKAAYDTQIHVPQDSRAAHLAAPVAGTSTTRPNASSFPYIGCTVCCGSHVLPALGGEEGRAFRRSSARAMVYPHITYHQRMGAAKASRLACSAQRHSSPPHQHEDASSASTAFASHLLSRPQCSFTTPCTAHSVSRSVLCTPLTAFSRLSHRATQLFRCLLGSTLCRT
jgi:hypothetical protein